MQKMLKKLKKLLDIEPGSTSSGSGSGKSGAGVEASETKPSSNGSGDGTGGRLPAINQPTPGIRRAETADIATTGSSGAASTHAPYLRQVTAQTVSPSSTPTPPSGAARTALRIDAANTHASAPASPATRSLHSPNVGAAPVPRHSLTGKSGRPSTDEPASTGPAGHADRLRTAQSGGLASGRGSVAPPSTRGSNAGNGPLPSINDSNSSLSSMMSNKLKNMVFVEAPATIEIESGAEPLVLPGGPTPLAAPGQGGTPSPYTISAAAAAQLDAKMYRRVQRIRSLPMLIDTNPLHHHTLHAQAAALQGGIVTIPSNDAMNNTEAMAAAAQLHEADEHVAAEVVAEALKQQAQSAAQAQAARGGPRRAPRRHASLKHLLNLDSYDFVTDVNVAEAQEEVESDHEGEGEGHQATHRAGPSGHGPTRNDPLAILQQMTQPDLSEYKQSNILAVNKALPRGMKRSMWSVRDYTLHKKLHQGYASDVYFAKCNLTGELVVLKVYRLADQCDLQRVQLYREIRVHSRLQHQNVVQFYAAFLEDNCVVIVQEYAAGGDLLRYMYKYGGRLTERQAVNLVLQPFLSALLYLHTQGIIHRDIKPENCLLTDSRLLKLADFGLAVDLNEERANTRAGTLDYMAPEVLRCPTKQTPDQFKSTPGAAHYQMGADAWAVGVFAYELIAGAPPFKADQMIDTARNIISVNITYPSTISELARDFIASCLRKHPGDRPTVIEMLHHPWIQMFQRRASVRVPPVMGTFNPRSSVGGEHSGQGHAPSPLNPSALAPSGSASPRAQQQYIQQQALQAAAYREQMLRRVGGAGR